MPKSAARLLALRKRRKKSQREVAEAVGISYSSIAMYELGLRTPRDEVKKALAKYYGTTVQSIFFS